MTRTKSQNFKNSRLVLQLSLPNALKPGVKSRMKMQLEQRRRVMLQLHLSDQQVYCLLKCVLYYWFYGIWIMTESSVEMIAWRLIRTKQTVKLVLI